MTIANVTRTAYTNGTIADATAANSNEDALVLGVNTTIAKVNLLGTDVTTLQADMTAFKLQLINTSIAVAETTTASALGYTNIQMLHGGQFVLAGGVTFTIDVPFTGGAQQWFSGTGTVAFNEVINPVINNLWFASDASICAGTQLTGPADGTGTHYIALRGGSSGTPRLYVMPYGDGEANTKSAIKLFATDYFAASVAGSATYEDLGLYCAYGITDTFTGDGSTTAFSLTSFPASGTAFTVTVATIPKTEGVDFTVASGVITFAVAPFNGAAVSVGYASNEGAFAVNSKATRKGSETLITAKPVNFQFNDSTANCALQMFTAKPKAAAKTITNVSAASSAVVTAMSHGYTGVFWVYITGIVGTMSVINGRWYIGTKLSNDTFSIDVSTVGLGYTSGGTAQQLSGGAAYAALSIGGVMPAGVSTFSGIHSYFSADASMLYGKMLRFYNSTNTTAGYGFKMNSSNNVDVYYNDTVVASIKSIGIVSNRDVTVKTTGSAGATSPSVATSFISVPVNGSPYNITSLSNGVEGQRVTLLFADTNATVVHATGLKLNGSANFVSSAGATLSLLCTDGTNWVEIGRSKP